VKKEVVTQGCVGVVADVGAMNEIGELVRHLQSSMACGVG
jgi:hypothetical protein